MDCPAGPGQCEACASGACQSSTCPSTPPASLNTGFPTGNTGAGNMFDVVASADVMVNTITVLPAATGPSTFEVWTTDDGIAGKLDDAGAWSAHAPINVDVTAVAPLALPVDLAIPIAAGTTKGFYVTEAHYDDGGGSAAGAKLKYATSATAVGTPAAADSALTIDVGYGTVYPFGQTFAQRTWSGAISYTPTLTTGTWSATKLAQGITFDITALSDVRISNIGLHVGSNVNHTVNVYVRAGSYAGFENDATAWHQVASARLPGFAPRVPIDPGVVIPAGQTYGFYVMMPGTPLIYAYTATAAGTLLGANNLITITAGQSELGTFGGNDGNGGLDGTVAVAPCP